MNCPDVYHSVTILFFFCYDYYIFSLSGVAGYRNFHYVAYCRKLSGAWKIFDDTRSSPDSVNDSTEITPHGVLYIAEKQ